MMKLITCWFLQSCSEMVMPSCSNGVTDLFENNPWDFEAFTKSCQKKWGVTPRPNWILEQFGGKNIRAASNIIFRLAFYKQVSFYDIERLDSYRRKLPLRLELHQRRIMTCYIVTQILI